MAKSIVGLFDQVHDAEEAAQELIGAGIAKENISFIANNPNQAADQEDDSGVTTGSAAATGAGMGAVVGGLSGLLVGLGALMIPGIGPVLAAGPLVAALGGAGIGAMAGSVIGALTQAGVPHEDAQIYAEGIRQGGKMLLVYASDEQADRVADIMNRHSAVNIDERATAWKMQRWNGFNENSAMFAFDREPENYKMRDPQSEIDYGPGARLYEGKPVADYDRGAGDMGNYQNAPADDWKMYESRFLAHFKKQYANDPNADWTDYRGSYRLGFDMAHLPEFSNHHWAEIDGDIRQQWERQFPNLDWQHYEHAVKDGFEAGHVPH